MNLITAAGAAFKLEGLMVAGAFPHPVTCLVARETLVSRILLTGPFAYKFKKPVQLDFLDATTLDRRRNLCEEEVRLNRRLAPDLYLGVVAIREDAAGVHVEGRGTIVEWAVRMRQFDAADELVSLLDRREVTAEHIGQLGVLVAQFHRSAAAAPADPRYPHTGALRQAVRANLAALAAHADLLGDGSADLGRLIDWTHDGLKTLRGRLALREQDGFVREGHGDLHAGNVVRWHGRLTPFDCLEFDPALRWIDVVNDAAFLAMDLIARQRQDLAAVFLDSYLAATGDYAGVRLLRFYAVYRALVRAKVDALQARQDPHRRSEFQRRLRARVGVAASLMEAPRPALVIMHGPSGSGKSWLSGRLLPRLGAVRVRSDVERRRVAAAAVQAGSIRGGMYGPEATRRTYGRALDCAEACLDGGHPVIVDATFLDARERASFRALAARAGAAFLIVSCTADAATLQSRVTARRMLAEDPSEADAAVLADQLRHPAALEGEEQPHTLVVDTRQPGAADAAVAVILSRLDGMRREA